jgi:hypothetical protein
MSNLALFKWSPLGQISPCQRADQDADLQLMGSLDGVIISRRDLAQRLSRKSVRMEHVVRVSRCAPASSGLFYDSEDKLRQRFTGRVAPRSLTMLVNS